MGIILDYHARKTLLAARSEQQMLGMGNVCLELDLVSEWPSNEKLREDLAAHRRNQRTRSMCPTYQNLRNHTEPARANRGNLLDEVLDLRLLLATYATKKLN